ncbi:MAG: hypothetical protein HY692_07965 [Cyanobacteria bacterium NC_groundwater_1444_Ag_S-0.65um_54_12]|nr:hypothetical protein [Cyanobacteria bacterium NC_groundwater_1444_Ag_S-0.65um_54_12]
MDRLLELYRAMRLARHFAERMNLLQRQGQVVFYLASQGEEAVSAAAAHVLEKTDWLFPSFRDLAALLHRGVPLVTLAHQYFATGDAPAKGRVLPIFHAYRDWQIAPPGANGAAHLLHAVGVAMAARLRHEPCVVLASFAAGAVDSGDFHAALSLASNFHAPVVFLCHQHSPESLPAAIVSQLAQKADGYGLASSRADGHDVLAMISALGEAVERARVGAGATLVTATTEEETKRDPLVLLRNQLERQKLWDPQQQKAEEQQDHELIAAAIATAKQAAPPAADSLLQDVYSSPSTETAASILSGSASATFPA